MRAGSGDGVKPEAGRPVRPHGLVTTFRKSGRPKILQMGSYRNYLFFRWNS